MAIQYDISGPEDNVYQRAVNSPLRKPGLAITTEQEQLIRSHIESGDTEAAQTIVIEALDQWGKDNPPRLEHRCDCEKGCGQRVSVQLDEMGPVTYTLVPQRVLTYSTGIVRRFFSERGYGFIKPDCGGVDVWVHVNNCVEGYRPKEGDRVVYLTRMGNRAGLIAKGVG